MIRSYAGEVENCHRLSEEIRHSPEEALYQEIETYLDDMGLEPTAAYNGVIWYAQAAIADPRDGESAQRWFLDLVKEGLPPLAVLSNQVTGATILRLYVALVYLRGDWFRQAVGRATLDSAPSLLRYATLLNHVIVKHLRYSLAHGHISPMVAGLHIKDRAFEIVLSPDLLNMICHGIWILHRAIFTVDCKRAGIKDCPVAFKWAE